MPARLSMQLTSDMAELARLSEAASALLDEHRVTAKPAYTTQLVLEELITNVIRHGRDGGETRCIKVEVEIDPGAVRIDVVDDAPPFNPLEAPAVDAAASLDERRVGGLGIHLVRTMADEVNYQRVDDRNHVTVRIGR